MKKFDKIQRRGTRFVTRNYSRSTRGEQIVKDLKWEDLSTRRYHSCLILFYQIINKQVAIPFVENQFNKFHRFQRIIKDTASLILKPLTHAINLSLIMGYFPEQLKLAKVIPIFKGGDPDLLSNYRPVSVLPAFSKLYERIYYKRLLSYISSQNIRYDNQFGFRARHSTGLALNILVDKITESLDPGESMVGVFLDFSKAFDTVDHNILLSKLHTYGIRGPPPPYRGSEVICLTANNLLAITIIHQVILLYPVESPRDLSSAHYSFWFI